jgi:hypothetical protein
MSGTKDVSRGTPRTWQRAVMAAGTVLAASVISLSMIAPAMAASDTSTQVAMATGVNPETAVPILGGSTLLQPGGVMWYGFQYAGDQSQIQVILNAGGQSGLSFGVWTPDLIKQYEAGNAVNPIGLGSPNADVAGADLFWTGNFDQPATYFFKVENDAMSPIGYTLSVNGSGVWAPAGATAMAAPDTTGASLAPMAPSAVAVAAPGASSETALPANGSSTTLNPGASAWFGFNYAGDQSQIQAILNAQGQTGLSFGVWTPDLIKQYEAGQAVSPIGMGSPNADVAGADLFWTGNFDLAAKYFVLVTNNGTTPITFALQVLGSGVF